MAGKRGPKISPTVRAVIRYAALNDKRPRRVVAVDLQKQIERLEEPVPTEETLLKLISEERNSDPNPEDQPWTLQTLSQYPIPPEALSPVLQAWVYAREELGTTFTVREAKWVARLYAVVKDIKKLTSQALGYALTELMAEIVGGKVNSLSSNLKLFELMTGEEVTPERKLRILDENKRGWLGRERLERTWKQLEKIHREEHNERPHRKEV